MVLKKPEKKKKRVQEKSHYREPSRRRSNQQQRRPTPAVNPQRGGRRRLLALAAGGVGARVGYGRLDEVGPAHLVDHRGRVDVVEVERLGPVGRRARVDGHGAGQAGVAGREAARGQADAQGQVVDVAVRGGGPVRDGVGEAVALAVVVGGGGGALEAGGVVGDVVGEEARVGLPDLRVLVVVVFLAGGGGAEREGEGGHEGGAGGEEDGAGRVQDGGDGGDGAAGVEEGHGVLKARRVSSLEGQGLKDVTGCARRVDILGGGG